MNEICNCGDSRGGFVNINHPVEPHVWVHGLSSCLLPVFPWWLKFEKFCDECGRSFSSPWSDLCEQCSKMVGVEYHGWLSHRDSWRLDQSDKAEAWRQRYLARLADHNKKTLDEAPSSVV